MGSADPSCKAIDPETGEVVDAALNKGIYICGKTGTGKSLALDLLRDFACRCRGHGCVFNGNYENLGWQNYRADDIVDRFCEGESLNANASIFYDQSFVLHIHMMYGAFSFGLIVK